MDFTWLKRLLLPFEFEDHELYSPKPYQPELDPDWDDLGEETRPRYKGSMLRHTKQWYAENEPGIDFDSLPKE